RGSGTATNAASWFDPFDNFQFKTALMATFFQEGQGSHSADVPLGLQWQVLPTDLEDTDAFFGTFSDQHFIPNRFQGKPQDIEPTGDIGYGRGTEHLDFFHTSIISDSYDIRKDTRCGHIRPGSCPFYDHGPVGIALGLGHHVVVSALQV